MNLWVPFDLNIDLQSAKEHNENVCCSYPTQRMICMNPSHGYVDRIMQKLCLAFVLQSTKVGDSNGEVRVCVGVSGSELYTYGLIHQQTHHDIPSIPRRCRLFMPSLRSTATRAARIENLNGKR